MFQTLFKSLYIYSYIDFSINDLSTENRLWSQRTPTKYKIKLNNCKLINLLIRIALTWAIVMTQFSNFLRNTTIYLCMFLYLETCFLIVTVSLLWWLQAVSKIHAPIYPYLISEGTRNCLLVTAWPRNRDSQETR